MGGYWYRDHDVRDVQCPNPECKRVFSSGKDEPQCSKCHQRFWGDYHLYKTTEDRQKDRKIIIDLVGEFKKNREQMVEDFRKKTSENDQILKKIEDLLRPV